MLTGKCNTLAEWLLFVLLNNQGTTQHKCDPMLRLMIIRKVSLNLYHKLELQGAAAACVVGLKFCNEYLHS